MATRKPSDDELLAKIRRLPPEKVAEVEDFVDFLCLREEERRLARAAAKLSKPAVEQVWDNPDDAAYDRLWVQLSRRAPRRASAPSSLVQLKWCTRGRPARLIPR